MSQVSSESPKTRLPYREQHDAVLQAMREELPAMRGIEMVAYRILESLTRAGFIVSRG